MSEWKIISLAFLLSLTVWQISVSNFALSPKKTSGDELAQSRLFPVIASVKELMKPAFKSGASR